MLRAGNGHQDAKTGFSDDLNVAMDMLPQSRDDLRQPCRCMCGGLKDVSRQNESAQHPPSKQDHRGHQGDGTGPTGQLLNRPVDGKFVVNLLETGERQRINAASGRVVPRRGGGNDSVGNRFPWINGKICHLHIFILSMIITLTWLSIADML